MQTSYKSKMPGLHRLFVAVYFVFITVASVYVYKRPAYNWDMMGYMAIVVATEQKDPAEIRRIVYSEAKQHTPAHAYTMLTNTTHHFIGKVTNNPNAFYTILPYYAVKPLYVGWVYLLYKSGFTLVKATALPSVACYWLTGVFIRKIAGMNGKITQVV